MIFFIVNFKLTTFRNPEFFQVEGWGSGSWLRGKLHVCSCHMYEHTRIKQIYKLYMYISLSLSFTVSSVLIYLITLFIFCNSKMEGWFLHTS